MDSEMLKAVVAGLPYMCGCEKGWRFDGVTCSVDQTCDFKCDATNGVCQPDDNNNWHCQCVDGYAGDGYHCVAMPGTQTTVMDQDTYGGMGDAPTSKQDGFAAAAADAFSDANPEIDPADAGATAPTD